MQPEAEGKASRFVVRLPLFWSGNTFLADRGAWGPHCRYGVFLGHGPFMKQTSITPDECLRLPNAKVLNCLHTLGT